MPGQNLDVLTVSEQDMKHVATHSHLRGTCLLTAQQAMVDVTSNYKTSLTAFSSVNMVFMLAVVLWISASFALFYVGGDPKSRVRPPHSHVCMMLFQHDKY